jgi:hypothetical protein
VVRSTIALTISLLLCGFSNAQQTRNVFVPYSDNLKALADTGDTDGETALGVAYLQGNGTKRDVALAASLFQAAYKQGDADAAAWLGSLYIAGQGVPANVPKGLALIKEAQDDGSSVGVRFAASALEKGIGQPANVQKALDLYQIAANQLDPVARDRMAMAFEAGLYRTQDLDQAAALYDQASAAGYSWAQLHLGELYASNLGFNDARENRAKGAEPWLREAYNMYVLSANGGNRVGAFRRGQALAQGAGVGQDLQGAEAAFRQAIQQRYGPAQEALADMYAQNPELGHSKIDQYILLKRAVSNGQESARAKLSALEKSMPADQVAFANAHVVAKPAR